MNLCCVLSGYKIEYDCTCDLRWHDVCHGKFQTRDSEYFAGFNSLADYHYLNAPGCAGVKRYEERWLESRSQVISNE